MSEINIKQLSTDEILGQVFMPRIDFSKQSDIDNSFRLVEEYSVAGFIIFNGELEQVKKTVEHLRSLSKYPLFFGCDAERGLGQIVRGGTKFPFLMSQGAADNTSLLERQAEVTAAEMAYSGINVLFAPVLDINSNPDNPIINIRSFSDEPETVSRLAEIFIKKARSCGIMTCGKHFPGHGSTDIDSHVSLAEIKRNKKELQEFEFIPFISAIKSGVEFIMLGHIALPEIDNEPVPAIMSKTAVQQILREELQFKNIVITDSFRMDAIDGFGTEFESGVRSIIAGCDIILDPRDPAGLIDKIKLEIKNNEMLLSKIIRSAQTVLGIKKNIPGESAEKPGLSESNLSLVQDIANESVCIVKEGKIDSGSVEINIFDSTESGSDVSLPFIKCLEANGIKVSSVNYITEDNISLYSSGSNSINLIYTSVSAWTGHSILSSSLKTLLEKISLSDNKNILVSFGSPYVIKGLDQFDVVYCLFDKLPECQIAAAENLLSLSKSSAKLPIKI